LKFLNFNTRQFCVFFLKDQVRIFDIWTREKKLQA